LTRYGLSSFIIFCAAYYVRIKLNIYHSSMQFVREHCQTFGASNTVNTRAYAY